MTRRLSCLRNEDWDFLPCRGRSEGRPGDGGGDSPRMYSDGESKALRGLSPGDRVEVEDVDDVEETERLLRPNWFFMVSSSIRSNK